MADLKDLCCVEACVLLAPNERQGAELLRLGLLELSLFPHLTINCTPVSTTIEITKEQLETIQKHDTYKAFHIFLKEVFESKTTATLQEIISTAQKYFGLGLEGFNKYAITPSLNSKDLLQEEHYKRFFIFKSTKQTLTENGEKLKQDLIHNLQYPENLVKQHALLRPTESETFTPTTLRLINCFNKAYIKQFKTSSAHTVKEPGLF